MRITAFSDDKRILDTSLEKLKLISPKVSQEDNKVGSFTFTIYPDHPYYNYIAKMKSIITVYEEGISEPLFRGRVYDEKIGFYNEKQVSCEGELAFLLDSMVRPYSFPATGQSGTPAELFTQYINNHNSQVDSTRQFKVGNITVTDPNNYIHRSNTDYVSTWDELNNKLIKLLGGHLWVRHEADGNYIDYLSDFNVLSNQYIEFGKNLLDLKKNIKVDSFATAVIPLGASIKDEDGYDTGERLTIKSVNNNVDYVYNSAAVAEYGYIFATNTWDDVTDASNLKRKGQAYIDNMAQFTASIDVSAADLNGATIDGQVANVNSFRIGRYVKVNTKPHSIQNQNFIVSKLSRELLKPENTKLTLGTTYKTLTEKQLSQVEQLNQYVQTVNERVKKSKGIKGIVECYAVSTSNSTAPTSWSTDIPTMTTTNKYLWNYEEITYTDDSVDEQTPRVIGVYGDSGSSGKGISSIVNYYLATNASSGVTKSTSGWTTTVQSVSSTKKYLWNYEVVTYTNSTTSETTPCIIGAYGDTGTKGTSYYTHIRYSANSDGTGFVTTPDSNTKYIGVYTGTSSTAPTNKTSYIWSKYVGDNGTNGTNGKDGNGITSITYYYATSTTQTAPSAASITSTTIPTLSATNKYLWQKEVIDFTDTSVEDKTTVILLAVYGDKGQDGTNGTNGRDGTSVTISSTSITYQASTSGTTTPTGTWSTSVPTVANGSYLWTKTVVTYSDSTSTTAYSVAYKGTNGTNGTNGTGISSITEEYYLSTSKITQTGGSWTTTPPTWSSGKYIWTRSKIVYTNPASTVYTTPVCDSSWEAVNEIQVGGRNLQLGTEYWSDSCWWSKASSEITDNTLKVGLNKYPKLACVSVKPNEEYTISIDIKSDTAHDETVTNKPILLDYYDSSNTRVVYENIPIASRVETTWQRYSYTFKVPNNDAITQLSIGPRSGDTYVHYFRFLKLEKGNKPTDWTPAPEDVDTAIGANVNSVDIYYYLSTSSITLAGGSWNTTAPTWENGKYIWQKTITTLANGTTSETTPVCITGAKNTAIQSDTAPTDTTLMWLDTSSEPPLMKRWDGSSWVVVNDMTSTITLLEQRFTADIESSEKNIRQTLTESYYTKDATESLVSAASSSWEQTAKGFEMQFTNISKDINDVSNNADTRFQEISQYIRFENGNIILGESDSELVLRIENDRISFLQNNTEVAYFSDRKLYVTDGEYTNSLQLGKFAFIPRTNGNLSFKKIVD